MQESSGVSIDSLPAPVVQKNTSINLNPSSLTVQPQRRVAALRSQMRCPSPIDSILETARRRAATPLGTRQNLEEQQNGTTTPLPYYPGRSYSPMTVASQPVYSYSQRFLSNASQDQNSHNLTQHHPPPPQYPTLNYQTQTLPSPVIPSSPLNYKNPNLTQHNPPQYPPLNYQSQTQASYSVTPPPLNYQNPNLAQYHPPQYPPLNLETQTLPPLVTSTLPPKTMIKHPPPPVDVNIQHPPPPVDVAIPHHPLPVDAFSPNSQDAFIGINVPGVAVSPKSNYTRHSAAIEHRKHPMPTIDSKRTIHSQPDQGESRQDIQVEIKNEVSETNNREIETEGEEEKDDLSKKSNKSLKKSQGEKFKKGFAREPRRNRKKASQRDYEKSLNAIEFDPDQPELYWTQLAIRVSAEILKNGTGREAQKFAEAAQLAIIQAGLSYFDNSPDTVNLVASKASMAVLDAGGDARVAAMTTVAVLNAETDCPSNEEEIREKMVELFGSARNLVKRGYEDSSTALNKISEIASIKLKEAAQENTHRYHEKQNRLRHNPPYGAFRDPRSRDGLMGYVDGFVNDMRYQYHRSMRDVRSAKGRSSRRRNPHYRGYSSDEDMNHRRHPRQRKAPPRPRSRSSSYSDESSYDRPRRRDEGIKRRGKYGSRSSNSSSSRSRSLSESSSSSTSSVPVSKKSLKGRPLKKQQSLESKSSSGVSSYSSRSNAKDSRTSSSSSHKARPINRRRK